MAVKPISKGSVIDGFISGLLVNLSNYNLNL